MTLCFYNLVVQIAKKQVAHFWLDIICYVDIRLSNVLHMIVIIDVLLRLPIQQRYLMGIITCDYDIVLSHVRLT